MLNCDSSSGPWLAGKKEPPMTASESETMAMAEPACSSFLVKATVKQRDAGGGHGRRQGERDDADRIAPGGPEQESRCPR